MQGVFSICMQIMTDPDAPSPSEPTMREWIHWWVDFFYFFSFSCSKIL